MHSELRTWNANHEWLTCNKNNISLVENNIIPYMSNASDTRWQSFGEADDDMLSYYAAGVVKNTYMCIISASYWPTVTKSGRE